MLDFTKGKQYLCIEDTLFKTKERSEYGLSFMRGRVYTCNEDGIIVGNDQFYDRFGQTTSDLELCLVDIKYKKYYDKIMLFKDNGISRLGVDIRIDKEVIENSARFLGTLVRENMINDKVELFINDARDGWTIFFDFYRENEQYRTVSIEIGKTQIAWDVFWDDDLLFDKGSDCDFYTIPERLKQEMLKL